MFTRYIFQLVPFMIITYSYFLSRLERVFGRLYKAGFIMLVMFMMMTTAVMSKVHYDYTSEGNQIMKDIYDNTEEGSVILGNAYVLMFVNGLIGDRKAIKIYPVSKVHEEQARLLFIRQYSDKIPTYLVFIDNRESTDPFEKNRKITGIPSEDRITDYFNTQLVFESVKPYHIKIYKVSP